jgi:hypothetical protein
MAYSFMVVMLLSQVGLPMHMHYCKGMLESVSVFFSLGCDDHKEPQHKTILRDCCQKEIASDCSNEKNNCCDDEIKLVTQELTSVSPNFTKWVDVQPYIVTHLIPPPAVEMVSSFSNPYLHQGTDSGPPIYLMQHALIFYG